LLYGMLDDICARIGELDRKEAVPVFADQLRLMRPSLGRGLFVDATPEEERWAAHRLAEGYLSLVAEIPSYVGALARAARDPDMEGGYRAAILGSLAYLVQPRDLIPDDLPGGFGLLDDCLLLHVTTCECIAYLPRDVSTAHRELLLANLLALTIPDQRLEVFREEANNVRQVIFHLGMTDPDRIGDAIAAIEADPLSPGPAADPAGYRTTTVPPPGPDYFAPARSGSVRDDGLITFRFDEGLVEIYGGEVRTAE